MTPVTVITGASAGIGSELARVFAGNGHHLVLVARRERPMSELAAAIASGGGPKPLVLPMDLAQPDAAARIGEALAARELAAPDRVDPIGVRMPAGGDGPAVDQHRTELAGRRRFDTCLR